MLSLVKLWLQQWNVLCGFDVRRWVGSERYGGGIGLINKFFNTFSASMVNCYYAAAATTLLLLLRCCCCYAAAAATLLLRCYAAAAATLLLLRCCCCCYAAAAATLLLLRCCCYAAAAATLLLLLRCCCCYAATLHVDRFMFSLTATCFPMLFKGIEGFNSSSAFEALKDFYSRVRADWLPEILFFIARCHPMQSRQLSCED